MKFLPRRCCESSLDLENSSPIFFEARHPNFKQNLTSRQQHIDHRPTPHDYAMATNNLESVSESETDPWMCIFLMLTSFAEVAGLALNAEHTNGPTRPMFFTGYDSEPPPAPKLNNMGIVATDITNEFKKAAQGEWYIHLYKITCWIMQALELGQLVKDPFFTLFEAVGALEVRQGIKGVIIRFTVEGFELESMPTDASFLWSAPDLNVSSSVKH